MQSNRKKQTIIIMVAAVLLILAAAALAQAAVPMNLIGPTSNGPVLAVGGSGEVTVTADQATAACGQAVVLSAAGGLSDPLFELWIQEARDGSWSLLQAYSHESQVSFTRSIPGQYRIVLFAREAAEPASDAIQSQPITVTFTKAGAVSGLTVNGPSGTRAVGSAASFTAAATDDGGIPLYQFWLHDAAGWQQQGAYSADPIFTRSDLQAGSYVIAVYALDQADVTAGNWNNAYYQVFILNVGSSLELTAPSTVQPGGQIILAAAATGLTGAEYQFWYRSPDSSWHQSGDYTSSGQYAFAAEQSGTYMIVAYAKDHYAPATDHYAVTATAAVVSAEPIAAPVFQNSEVTAQGDVSIAFDQAMADPAGSQGQFTVTVDGVPATVTAVQKTATATKIKLVLAAKVGGGQTVTVAYSKGSDPSAQIKSTDGGILESFVAQPVSNPLPYLVSAATSGDGTRVILSFSTAMASPAGKEAEFAVLVNGAADPVSAAALNPDPTKVELILANPVAFGDTVTVAYTKGTVKAADNGVLASFSAQPATNTVPAAAPQFVSSEVTTQGDVSITFDKVMADPTGTQGQFAITVNAAPAVVNAVQKTGTPTKIKLVLATKVTGGQTVTVAYSKGAEASTQIKSSDGGILESFVAQPVSNTL